MELVFESELSAPNEVVWDWMTSVHGIQTEIWPLLKMTVPPSATGIADVQVTPGRRLFRSWVLLFGILPIDRSDLTLLSLEPRAGFVEESPMLSMKRWRHERTLSGSGAGTRLTDRLTFEPRFATPVVGWFVRTIFEHRHRVLRKHLA